MFLRCLYECCRTRESDLRAGVERQRGHADPGGSGTDHQPFPLLLQSTQSRAQIPCGGTLSKLARQYRVGTCELNAFDVPSRIFTRKHDLDNTRDKLDWIGNRYTIDRILPQLETATQRHAADTPPGRLAPCAAEALEANKKTAGTMRTELKFGCGTATAKQEAQRNGARAPSRGKARAQTKASRTQRARHQKHIRLAATW